MSIRNTTLDDIAGVIGFSATMKLSAWFGENNVYVPVEIGPDQILVRLLGMPAAKRLTDTWPGEWLSVPRPIGQYEADLQKRRIMELIHSRMSTRRISHFMRISDRRIQQIVRELEVAGLIVPIALDDEDKPGQGFAMAETPRGKVLGKKTPGKSHGKKTPGKSPQQKSPAKRGV